MFYLIELTGKADKVEKGIYAYDTRNEAIANFHTKMGGAMKKDDYLSEMLMVIDQYGAVQIYDYYTQVVDPEPEPEPDPEEGGNE